MKTWKDVKPGDFVFRLVPYFLDEQEDAIFYRMHKHKVEKVYDNNDPIRILDIELSDYRTIIPIYRWDVSDVKTSFEESVCFTDEDDALRELEERRKRSIEMTRSEIRRQKKLMRKIQEVEPIVVNY